jgi:tripartite-type tricarboxylate transporter receptor subunit TctC
MKHLSRRTVLATLAASVFATFSHVACSQTEQYPTKPVKVVVAFSAGGTTDLLARSVSQKLSEKLGVAFVIENRPGGGGNIGTESVVRAAPDGYSLIVNSVGPISVNQSLYKNLNYDPLVDLQPIVQIADVPNVLVVHPSLPVNTFDEFIEYSKKNPQDFNYGSTGVGTSSHLSSFMLMQRLGTDALHVPYKGANALNDLLAGRLQFMFATIPSVISHIHSGKLKALAVSSPNESRSLPNVPTVASRFPGFEAGSWFGFFAPKGTPDNVVQLINKEVNNILPQLNDQMVREGADPVGGSPAQFAQFTQKEFEKWQKIVKDSGASVD